ncbi:MAG: 4-phosphoerythronate dehydrogenase [Bacteroidales bacterium]|nr:4-phosphoerythronate dehydrogenase [Bacteroidales bacterium]
MRKRPYIIIDEQIPYLEGITQQHAQIERLPYPMIVTERVRKADALLIRTRTRCSACLLTGSPVSFIGSPAIGTDHIDLDYCASAGIKVVNAPGCNAGAVVQYVFTSLVMCAALKGIDLCGKSMGIIGVGNVGSKVTRLAKQLGMKLLLNDPPRALAEGSQGFCELNYLLKHADVVTLHVPLDPSTQGMAGSDFFANMQEGACFINTSRGGVVDERALRSAVTRLGGIVLDVWQGEPDICVETLKTTDIATPHIAGYSVEGKRNASQTVVRALAAHFDWKDLLEYTVDLPPACHVPAHLLFKQCFPIMEEDERLRKAPERFEEHRNNYIFRREWTPEQYKRLNLCTL